MNRDTLRVRFAPSPTGALHVGGLRTALYNYLLARRSAGTFILRIEDTDRERFVEGAEQEVVDALRWAGLGYDEGPGVGGPHGPYRQSERKDLYRQYAQQLVEAGLAYYAFDTRQALDTMRDRLATADDPAPKYDARTRLKMTNALTLPEEEVRRRLDAGEAHVVRLKVPEGRTLRFDDQIRGKVVIESEEVDDQVLIKSDGMPTYHLANVVDDHLMGVTHVVRGEEWLPSTPKHILLYEFLGWSPPAFAHLPLILSPEGGKLSKRNAEAMGLPVTVMQYREAGYEPGALVNYLAFLGWNPGTEQEVFHLDALAEAFSLDRVGSAGIQFNLDKLKWYNQQYLREMTPEELAARARPAFEGQAPDDALLARAAALMQDRITFARELATEAKYLFEPPDSYDEKGVKKRWKADSADVLTAYADRLEAAEAFDEATAEHVLRTLAEERDAGAGRIIHPTRLALTGVSFGPSLFAMMEVLGRDECVRRIRKAVAVLG